MGVRKLLAAIVALGFLAATAAAAIDRGTAGYDFGDAPDGVSARYVTKPDVVGRFPSNARSDGPRHTGGGPRLGLGWTAEGSSRQVDRDSDDGASLEPRSCALSTLTVILDAGRVPAGSTIYVNAWFDWNQDGDWADGATGAACGPEWGVQNARIDPATLSERIVLLRLRFRGGRLPDELWWRVQAHVGESLPKAGGGGQTGPRAGETEDRLWSAAANEVATGVKLTCTPAERIVLHGTLHIVRVRLHTPPGVVASLLSFGGALRGDTKDITGGGRVTGLRYTRFFPTSRHGRTPSVQAIEVLTEVRALVDGVPRTFRVSCRFRVAHTPVHTPPPIEQPDRGPVSEAGGGGGKGAVDPIRPDPAQAGCSADFFSDPAGVRVGVRCQGIGPKLLTVATGVGIASLGGTAGTGSCGFSGDRKWVSCVVPKGRQGKLVGYLVLGTDRPVARVTIFVTAGGHTERGTTHVLRQDWWVTDRGYLCSQTVPRVELQRCATITAKPQLVREPPTTTVPG